MITEPSVKNAIIPALTTWVGVELLCRVPSHLGVAGKADAVYRLHIRRSLPSGKQGYRQRVVGLDRAGGFVPVMHAGTAAGTRDDHAMLILLASVKEDTYRASAMTATITDGMELSFSVPLSDYQRVFSQRELPVYEKSGRRKAIVHWVAEHIREANGRETTVQKHVRGVKDITLDGLKFRIDENRICA